MSTFMIGVVGGNNPDAHDVAGTASWQRVLAQADAVGFEIVSRGHLLATGGKHNSGSCKVKDRAMSGALTFGGNLGLVNLIPTEEVLKGIGGSVRRVPPVAGPSKAQELSLLTGTGSWMRDQLTGQLPNALVALGGDGGTCAECAFALQAGKPIVFLNSYERLKKAAVNQAGDFYQILLAVLAGQVAAELKSQVVSLLSAAVASAPAVPPVMSPYVYRIDDPSPAGATLAVKSILSMLENQSPRPGIPRLVDLTATTSNLTHEAISAYSAIASEARDFDLDLDKLIVHVNR